MADKLLPFLVLLIFPCYCHPNGGCLPAGSCLRPSRPLPTVKEATIHTTYIPQSQLYVCETTSSCVRLKLETIDLLTDYSLQVVKCVSRGDRFSPEPPSHFGVEHSKVPGPDTR